MTNKAKIALRWGGAALVFAIYSVVLMIPLLDYSLNIKYQGAPSTGTMEARICEAITYDLTRSIDNLFLIAFFGSAICLVLVLFIFKKVR